MEQNNGLEIIKVEKIEFKNHIIFSVKCSNKDLYSSESKENKSFNEL